MPMRLEDEIHNLEKDERYAAAAKKPKIAHSRAVKTPEGIKSQLRNREKGNLVWRTEGLIKQLTQIETLLTDYMDKNPETNLWAHYYAIHLPRTRLVELRPLLRTNLQVKPA